MSNREAIALYTVLETFKSIAVLREENARLLSAAQSNADAAKMAEMERDELKRENASLLHDRERLEWMLATLNRVGTEGFARIVHWGCEGLDRGDIDAARKS